MTRASAAERQRLHEIFAALCRIQSPSGQERECAQYVQRTLAAVGISSSEDDSAAIVGGECGNLLARVPGDAPISVLFCAHLDTVPPSAPIEPVVRDGGWENANEAILGADNKAAVATMLALAERLAAAPPPVGVELLFTVGEEVALAGAKAFDARLITSAVGYTFDSAMPLGGIVVASPTYFQLEADLHGTAAHAGVRPEMGRSAILAASRAIANMRLGRIDEHTTANIGTIAGGTAANVIPERCHLVGEARALDEARAEEIASEMVSALTDAANDPECECDLDVSLQRGFQGYRVRSSSPEARLAAAALRRCGFEPREITSGGGSDVNALRAAGLAVLNLANGTERNHEPTERISLAALEGILELAIALVESAGEVLQ